MLPNAVSLAAPVMVDPSAINWLFPITRMSGAKTYTSSKAVLLVSLLSRATIEIERVVVLVLVEENVTDFKAVWYWAGVALPLKVSTPPELLAIVMPPIWVKLSKSPD